MNFKSADLELLSSKQILMLYILYQLFNIIQAIQAALTLDRSYMLLYDCLKLRSRVYLPLDPIPPFLLKRAMRTT